jgi:hypothetical protein
MKPTIKVEEFDPVIRRRRERAAENVLREFEPWATEDRLLCFLDADDWPNFKDEEIGFGKANRGVSGPVKKGLDWYGWPPHVVGCFYPTISLSDTDPIFDFVAYLHASTCEDDLGLTMTLAHEVQHFLQCACTPDLWKANDVFKAYCRRFQPQEIYSHQLPLEQDARIVAKRITIRLHGPDAVDRYMEKNIKDPVDDLDGKNWQFIQALDVSKPFDLGVETVAFAERLGIAI